MRRLARTRIISCRGDFPFSRRGLGKLVPFLVTRQIFAGAGRVGAAGVSDEWVQVGHLILHRPGLRDARTRPTLPFQISQRADHIVNDFFEWVQQNRAIVNTRDEPLADPHQLDPSLAGRFKPV